MSTVPPDLPGFDRAEGELSGRFRDLGVDISCTAGMILHRDSRHLWVAIPDVANQDKKLASRAVKELVALADAHSVTLELVAQAGEGGRLTTDQLRSWYERNGFDVHGSTFTGPMVRTPR